MENTKLLITILLLTIHSIDCSFACHHGELAQKTVLHLVDGQKSIGDGLRFLQNISSPRQNLRIFVDYHQVKSGTSLQANTIKRIMNISTLFIHHTIKTQTISQLTFPTQSNLTCGVLPVPQIYQTQGVQADLGLIVGNQDHPQSNYVAKSISCALLASTNRPVWGMILWNNPYLKYDQTGFQQVLTVGVHELSHIIAFSYLLYPYFPNGNPHITVDGIQYLTSQKITAKLTEYFNCSDPLGIPLEDQDGTKISSHMERKVFGNQYMTASNKKGSYISPFVLALFDSTGWYDVDYRFAQPSVWGKNKGCSFLNQDDCSSNQFCIQEGEYGCDWDGTGAGKCAIDIFANTCKITNYFTNTVCMDENYELKNLNSRLLAKERGGYNSKCFISDLRQKGLEPTSLNHRCYISVCSVTGKVIFVLIGSNILTCITPGQRIFSTGIQIDSLEGVFRCPINFESYCSGKKTCAYHCNKNGLCINGECLCIQDTQYSSDSNVTCLDTSILSPPTGNIGGIALATLASSKSKSPLTTPIANKNNLQTPNSGLKNLPFSQHPVFKTASSLHTLQIEEIKPLEPKYEKKINQKCMQGTFLDTIFGDCIKCSQTFGCDNCNQQGCWGCNDGSPALNGYCKFKDK